MIPSAEREGEAERKGRRGERGGRRRGREKDTIGVHDALYDEDC